MAHMDMSTSPRVPLGGSKGFHRDVVRISDGRATWRQLEEARKILLAPSSLNGIKFPKIKQGEGNDNAQQAAMFRYVAPRVKTSHGQRKTGLTAPQVYGPHDRQEGATDPAMPDQHCDVLGHYACASCSKRRRQWRHTLEVERSYPGMDTSERCLCQGGVTLPHIDGAEVRRSQQTEEDDAEEVMTPTELHFRVMAKRWQQQQHQQVIAKYRDPHMTPVAPPASCGSHMT